jgi:hypothetical protein
MPFDGGSFRGSQILRRPRKLSTGKRHPMISIRRWMNHGGPIMVKRSALLILLLVITEGPVFSAQAPFYPLIVNGSSNLKVDYADGYLVVRFRRTRNGAGQPSTYARNVPPGSAAWVDRPLNAQEPLMLRQKLSSQRADEAFQRLRQNGGFWKFYSRNTGKGYFEVSKSEPAYASVRID